MGENNLEVIRYVGDNNVLVAKSKIVDFNSKSQIIVNESQEALLFKDGQALDLFPSGRHNLNTENLPFFKKIFAHLFSNKNPLPCEVYFINKVNVVDIQWGTSSPIDTEDPKYGLPIRVRAHGQMGIKIVDSRKFILKIVAQLSEFTVDDVKRTIKGALMPNVKVNIAKAIQDQKISILEITSHLLELSELTTKNLNSYISDFGLEAVHFYIDSISSPEEDLAKIKETKELYLQESNKLRIDVERTRLKAEADAYARQVQGYSYQEERKFDVLSEAAKNEGAGGTMSATMGLGMGFGVGKTISDSMNNMANSSEEMKVCPACKTPNKKVAKFCVNCGNKFAPLSRFCPNCGAKIDGEVKFCPECGTKLD